MNHYDILKAIKTGYAPDHYTAVYAKKMGGGSKEYERYISGELPLILLNSVGKPLVSWSITGNTVQDGEPSPDNPIEVKGTGDKTGNLVKEVYTIPTNNISFTFDIIENVKTYTLSLDTETIITNNSLYIWSDDQSVNIFIANVSTDINGHLEKTVTFTDEQIEIIKQKKNIRLRIFKNGAGTIYAENIMLNEGSEPLPYEPYGYKVPVVSRGKNYFNPSTTRYEYAVRVNEVVSYPGGAMYFIKAKPGKYTFKAKDNIPLVRFGCVSEPFTVGTIINNYAQADGYIKDTKMTIDNDCDYLMLQISGAYVDTHDLSVIQIELGTTATEYEPYIEPITTAIYLNSPLMADEVIDSEGKREVEWGKKDIIIEKTTPYDSHVLGICSFNSSDGTPSTDGATRQKSVCDRAPRGYAAMDGSFYVNNVNIVFVGSESDTINELKDRYDGAVVYYPLNTPTSETISVPTIPTLKGNTVLDVDTEVQPTNMSVTYKSRR